jgi:hypothetical protein
VLQNRHYTQHPSLSTIPFSFQQSLCKQASDSHLLQVPAFARYGQTLSGSQRTMSTLPS